MAGRKLLKASGAGQFQLFPEALERDPLQLMLDTGPKEMARVKAAEEARKARAAMMALPRDMFAKVQK